MALFPGFIIDSVVGFVKPLVQGWGFRLYGSTSGYIGAKPKAIAGSVDYVLPSADGSSGYVLSTDGSANLSWIVASGGGGSGTVTSITAGAGLSGGVITTSGTIAINLNNSNAWTAPQSFNSYIEIDISGSGGDGIHIVPANGGGYGYIAAHGDQQSIIIGYWNGANENVVLAGIVSTIRNTLDDGSGNVVINGTISASNFSGSSSGTNTGDQDLSGLVPKTTTVNGHALSSNVTVVVADITGAAPLASPTFTGTPAAPTPLTADNSTKIATTAYVKAQGYTTNTGTVTSVATDSSLTGGPITTTGTLGLNLSHINTWLANQIYQSGIEVGVQSLATAGVAFWNSGSSSKVTLLGGATVASFSLVLPTQDGASGAGQPLITDGAGQLSFATLGLKAGGTNADLSATGGSHQVLKQLSVGGAVTVAALAVSEITGAAPTASPALTGTPTAPTQLSTDNSTAIATTAFIKQQAYTTNLGTVTTVSVVSTNGFAGTVANASSTPAITLTTSITGVIKGNGTALSTATSGTDYAPGTSGLTTGILKSTTTTGVLSIAVAGDFPTLNQNTSGSAATLTTPRAINGVNFDGSAAITVPAAAGTLTGTTLASNVVTSYLTTVGTIGTGTWNGTKIGLLYGGTNADLSGTGGTHQFLAQVTTGAAITVVQPAESDLSFTDITTNNVSTTKHGFTPKLPNDATKYLDGTGAYSVPAGSGGGSGTVTTVSVVSTNGFAGTVANATTTPAITLTTSITGIIKGNGTAISAATAGTDYTSPSNLGGQLALRMMW